MDTGFVTKKKQKKKAKPAAGESGPFEGFLKVVQEDEEEEDGRDPAVFSTFLKSSGKGGAGAAAKAAARPAAQKVVERPSPAMAKVHGKEDFLLRSILTHVPRMLGHCMWIPQSLRPRFPDSQPAVVGCR